MPFSMGDEKGIDIDARLRLSMPSGTPGKLMVAVRKLMVAVKKMMVLVRKLGGLGDNI